MADALGRRVAKAPDEQLVGGVRAVARAAPKSISLAVPLVEMMMLSGLRSRCTSPSGPLAVLQLVHVLQRLAHVPMMCSAAATGSRWPARQHAPVHGAQRQPGDVRHRDEVAALELAEVEHVDDVGMAEPRGQRRLADEHLDQLGPVLQRRSAWS